MGYNMAKYLSTYNFDLFLVAKDKKELDKEFKDSKNKIKTYGFDLSKEEECIKLYKEVRNENIDILINNAGFGDAGNSDCGERLAVVSGVIPGGSISLSFPFCVENAGKPFCPIGVGKWKGILSRFNPV